LYSYIRLSYFICQFPVNGHIHVSDLPFKFNILSCLLQVSGNPDAGCVLVFELGELKNIRFNGVRDQLVVLTQPFNSVPDTVPRLAPTEISAGISY
jgi:hypothetical protein